MYASVNQWSYGGLSPLDCLKAAARQGFSGYEPAFGKDGPLSLEGFLDDAKTLRKAASDSGLDMRTLASGLYWSYPMSSDDESIRMQARDIVRKQIDCAAEMGAKVILVVPGTVGSGFFGKGATYGDAYSLAQEGLNAVADYAKEAGVVIGVENVWNNFLLSPLEFARFIDEIGSPFVQAYFDVGNVVLFGDSADWIRTLGKRVAAIHVKDFKKSVGTIGGFVQLLHGDVDWPDVMAALREIGYQGGLTAEISPMKLEPELAALNACEAIKHILTL